ncbi:MULTISPECIES: helix-turn-helix transcriptional regulator [Bacillus]|uniref:YafY family transcriptional regulator n=1 Tax=Bacillus glycinifermentans TaxID=1664069 RepID=A0AAJ3YVC4_9BACI|nr:MULTISPECIES: YafY family protein [Bacillus]MDU0073220.1 YafY family protein [Bacillus sp. IG6]MED8021057.1 YafY family protein [Bacillus glycinifermentans]QAT63970.1 YafY family transcriptional regulator [Bacillus glycinifermentans]WKB77851.1 YafY family protein [Bacillus glycinifermentans]SCA84355.1 DNA-binding protein [Bacillus glycinifermentans]
MRGDRLMSIVLLLQSYGRISAKALAEQLEVSERTIHRDMEALSGAGIPVYAERGKNGGWRLMEDYQTKLTGLKEQEIRSLFISPSTQLLEDLGLARPSREARTKLMASLPPAYREQAKEVWRRIHIDTSTWRNQTEKIAAFAVLQEAIWKENKLRITYERADGKTNTRIVCPLGLAAKGHVWYLIASHGENIRNYRASRIHSAQSLDETFTRPDDFNLAQYWEASTKSFIDNLPAYEVRALAAPSIFPRLMFTGRFVKIAQKEAAGEDGWIPVTFSFNAEKEALEYLLGFADQIKVLEPREMRQALLKAAKAAVDFYRREYD